MTQKKYYQTKQRDLILNFLKENKGRHMTAEQISLHFKNLNASVGQTTIYRHLDKFIEEGLVYRYETGQGIGACYLYEKEDDESPSHYHLICDGCGQLLHVECDFLDELSMHIQDKHRFKINRCKTVLHGCCDHCAEAK